MALLFAAGWIYLGKDENAMKRRLCCFLACLAAVFVATLGLAKPALADHQFLWWDETGDVTFATFNSNSEIRIRQGQMEFVQLCEIDGVNDYLWPSTDVYIMPSGSIPDDPVGTELEDVSGVPNTITSPTHFGMFIDESIGNSANIEPGEYAVIYDECQDGDIDPGDFVQKRAFEIVEGTTDVPSLPLFGQLKSYAAQKASEKLEELGEKIDDWFKAKGKIKLTPLGKVLFGRTDIPFTNHPAVVVRILQINLVKHYLGIFADPPDPAFNQITPASERENAEVESNDPAMRATSALAAETSSEGALAEALLHSLERYQGAQEAGSGRWALVHARAIRDYSLQLEEQMDKSNEALADLDAALAADTTDVDANAIEAQEFVEHVRASGFDADELREARNLGMSNTDIEDLREEIAALDFADFSESSLRQTIEEIRTTNTALATEFGDLAADMAPIISTLESDSRVADKRPDADAGGPYTDTEGVAVSFEGSATSSTSISEYEWDLDGDGEFDDATGASLSYTYHAPFHGLVGLRVTNADNLSNVAYARADIADSNKRPVIEENSPAEDTIIFDVGQTQDFGVTASDPDGDATSAEWFVDGTSEGRGNSFAYTPSSNDVGRHMVEVRVDDDSPLGEQVRHSWTVAVLDSDEDGDGYRANADCDDADPEVNPGEEEVVGNDKDDDCDSATRDDGVEGYVVTKTEDTNDGACDSDCSLREAITLANSHYNGTEPDEISFNIPGDGVQKIKPTSALPEIKDPVIIDGYTQPGASENTLEDGNDAVLKIELDGSNAWFADGLRISSGDTTVRGLVINHFSRHGIPIVTKGDNVIEGNYIGTDAEGVTARSRGNWFGVWVEGEGDNTIGGTTPEARNVISGNTNDQLRLWGGGSNQVQGNHIGPDADGTIGGQGGIGVEMASSNNTIGGTMKGARNLISGNSMGIKIEGARPTDATGNQVQGNYIGTDASGTKALGNRGSSGVVIEDVSNNTIGGTEPGAGNVISTDGCFSSSVCHNVYITDVGATGNKVQGNYIGTDFSGTQDLGNSAASGVALVLASGTTIGGTTEGAGNVISGNDLHGVSIGSTSNNLVQGNYIGTDKDGTGALGNSQTGVVIYGEDSTGNTVGGTETGAGNVIAFNGTDRTNNDGVRVDTGSSTGNTILSNSIFSNGGTSNTGLGIDLTPGDGTTPNDNGDGDKGANNLQNFPELASAKRSPAGNTKIEGTLDSTTETTFKVQFFSSTEKDPSEYGEGKTYLGEKDVTTDGSGQATFTFESPDASSGEFVTSTATSSSDGTSEFSEAVEVVSASAAPVASDQEVTISEDDAGELITLSATSADNATLTYEIIDLPDHGKLYKGDGTAESDEIALGAGDEPYALPEGANKVTYKPDENYNGEDSFAYRATDGTAPSNAATVTITVDPAKDVPVAGADSYTAEEDKPLEVSIPGILENDEDADSGDTLKVADADTNTTDKVDPVSGPSHGTLTLNEDGSFTYTPERNFSGEDSFAYRATDGTDESEPAKVTITVDPVNDPPEAQNDEATTDEDKAADVDVLANDSDTDSDTLSVETDTGPSHGTVTKNADGTLKYTPDKDYSGTDSFTYKVSDGNEGGTDTATVNITVKAFNDEPATDNDAAETDEDTAVVIDAKEGDTPGPSDEADQSLTVRRVSDPAHGLATIVDEGTDKGKVRYTPDHDYNGEDSFTYEVCDDGEPEGCATATVSVKVKPVNDAPTVQDDQSTTDEDKAADINVASNDSDVDGDKLTVTGVTQPANGKEVTINADGTLRYTPNENFYGTDSFKYTVEDGQGGSATAEVKITVNSVNDAPTADAKGPYETKEGGSVEVASSGKDVESQELTYEWDLDNDGTFETQGQNATFQAGDRDGPGSYEIRVRVTDPEGASGEANTTVKIENAAPWITALTGQSKVLTGEKFSFTANADDKSKVDRDEGFSWKWAIDNGSYAAGSNPFEATFSGCGKHTVSVTATDKDGAESEANSQNSTVSVEAYEGRFGQPLDEGKYNLVEKSRVVPVKITVGCGTEDLKDLKPAIQLFKGDSSTVSESSTNEVETYSSSAADTTGVMRAVDGGYIYNLQVPTKYKDGTQVKAGDLLTVRVRPFGDGNQEASMYVVLRVK